MGSNILLAIGSLIMFGTFLGSSNRLLMGNTQIASQNEYYIAALSYGQSVIEEARMKKFDGNLTASWMKNVGVTRTAAAGLGTDGIAEKMIGADELGKYGYLSESLFDDVDDYNNYRRVVNSSRAEGYELGVTVTYVDPLSNGLAVMTPTSCKRMTVRITSPYFPKIEKHGFSVSDTLTISYVFTQF